MNDRVAFLSTLIYGSVIYHRHRRSKGHRHSISTFDHERYDRFYNGPFSENGIVEAKYSNLKQHTDDGSTLRSEESPMDMGGPFESGGEEVAHRPFPSMRWRKEVTGESEVHELAAVRSVRSL